MVKTNKIYKIILSLALGLSICLSVFFTTSITTHATSEQTATTSVSETQETSNNKTFLSCGDGGTAVIVGIACSGYLTYNNYKKMKTAREQASAQNYIKENTFAITSENERYIGKRKV